MKMSGQQRIGAPRDEVWKALNDPEVLKRCIPGCQSVAKESENLMVAAAEIKIGPIGARFNAAVELSDIVPAESYTMNVDAQGGTVGFVKAVAKVKLTDDGATTLLSYDMDAQISGRLAQLGGPIMDATAKQMASRFFAQLGSVIGGPIAAPVAAVEAPDGTPTVAVGRRRTVSIAWLLVALLLGFIVGSEWGRRTASTYITVDPAVLEQLLDPEPEQ
jgi:carbon monoxide dehydrogenase subunit G